MRIRVAAAVVAAWAVLVGAVGPAYAEPVADPVTDPAVVDVTPAPAPEPAPPAAPDAPEGRAPAPEAPPAAPEVASPTLIGDPAAAAAFWGRQRYDDCVLMAAADVIGQVTGNKPSEDEMIALAATFPNGSGTGPLWAVPADPPPPPRVRKMQLPVIADLPPLLARFNVPSVVTDTQIAAAGGPPTGMLALEDALRAGRAVIASVNGETIWDQPGDRSVHNHSLVVTGVDPERGIVHLNDSAIVSPGPDSRVSLAAFVDAWATSDYNMLIAG